MSDERRQALDAVTKAIALLEAGEDALAEVCNLRATLALAGLLGTPRAKAMLEGTLAQAEKTFRPRDGAFEGFSIRNIAMAIVQTHASAEVLVQLRRERDALGIEPKDAPHLASP